MKRILNLFLCGMLILGATGCSENLTEKESSEKMNVDHKVEEKVEEKENKKEIILTCSGDYMLTYGLMIGTKNQVSGGKIEETEAYSYAFDSSSDYGSGEYKFIFDETKLIKLEYVETLYPSYSKQITDSDLNNPDNAIEGCKFYRNNEGNVVFDCVLDSDDKTIIAFNTDANTPDKLKSVLEKNTSLVCE